MATVNSTTYQAMQEAKIALNPGVANTTVHVTSGSYEASALAADSIINLVQLPKGAVIHGITLAFDALGSGTTINVGDSNKTARYLSGIDTSKANTVNNIGVDAMGYTIGDNDGDNVLQAKVSGAAATGTIKFAVFYAV